MFQDPNTMWIEVIVLLLAAGFILSVIGVYVYKKVHHLPTDECACCHKSTKKMLKEYHKYCSCKK